MTLFKPYRITSWPQNILNGWLRPNVFFRDSLWDGESWWSVLCILLFSFFSYLVSCEIHLQNGIHDWRLMAGVKYGLTFLVVSFLVSTFLDACHKLAGLSGGLIEYLSFSSYVTMSYAVLQLCFFVHQPIYLFLSWAFIPWVFFGFQFSFSKRENGFFRKSVGWATVALICLFLYPVSILFINWVRSSGIPKSSESYLSSKAIEAFEEAAPKVKKALADIGLKGEAGGLEINVEPYTLMAEAKEGDIYSYEVRFRRNSKVVFGQFNVKYLKINSKEKKYKVAIDGYLGKKPFKIVRNFSELSALSDLNLLNTNNEISIHTALRLLATSHISVQQVPNYYAMGWTAFVKDAEIKKSQIAGIEGYRLTKIPNGIFVDKNKLKYRQNIFMSQRAPLPLMVEGQLPTNKVWYSIQLKNKESAY